MSILSLAESDLAVTLEDPNGFGKAFTLTDPAGSSGTGPVNGQDIDIGEVIDPDTGMPVSGRFRGVSLRLSSITAIGLDVPRSVTSGRNWVVTDDAGAQWTVEASKPDRTLGVVSLILKEAK